MHHNLTNIWQKYSSWLKALRLCDVCFCWWHAALPACADMLAFPLWELACVCCVCLSPIWLVADSFRCPSSSSSLIRAEAPAIAGRKPLFQEVAACYFAAGFMANLTSIHLRKRKTAIPILSHSQIPSLWTPALNGRCGRLCLYWVLWLTCRWQVGQKYTPLTVHDSTPLHKIFWGMLFFKVNFSCIWGALWVTEPSLWRWMMMSYLGNHHWDSRKENKNRSGKKRVKQRLEVTAVKWKSVSGLCGCESTERSLAC